MSERPPPMLRLGRCAEAPEIDGRLDDEAWGSAAGFTGLVNIIHQRLSALPTTVRLTYDDEGLDGAGREGPVAGTPALLPLPSAVAV